MRSYYGMGKNLVLCCAKSLMWKGLEKKEGERKLLNLYLPE